MYKAIFFDFDDTLEDWLTAKKYVRRILSKKVSEIFKVDKEKFAKTFAQVELESTGKSLSPTKYKRSRWLNETLKRLGIKASETRIKELERFYWREALSKVKAFPDTVSVLKRLDDYMKIIITDSDGCLNNYIKNRKIAALGIRHYFDLIITSNDTRKNKPHNSMWKLALKKMKLNPKECIMIGDKPELDLKPAKELGMTTVWIKQGDWPAVAKGKKFKYVDHEISRLSELLRLL